jgi:hypothetical protein
MHLGLNAAYGKLFPHLKKHILANVAKKFARHHCVEQAAT